MRSKEPISIAGHLTAAGLLGYQPEKQLPKPIAKVLQNDNLIYAVYPSIVGEAYKNTMDKYRKHVAEYNFRTRQENELIKKHNSAVRIYKKNNQLTDIEKEYIKIFPAKHSGCNDRQFNQAVEEAGEFGKLILKRKIQTIKPVTELFFSLFLNIYNEQLIARNTYCMSLGIRVERPIQKLDLNSQHVKNCRRDELVSIETCTKTVRNHRMRLQEAEILTDYSFHGRYTGVKLHINDKILVVYDLHTKKLAVSENQLLRENKGNVLPDLYVTTGTFKEEYKKKDDATQSSCDKELPPATTSLHYKNKFYTNTGGNLENFTGGAAPENVKVSETPSDKLQELILHPQDLAEKLATGHYDNYIPLDIRELKHEAYSGTMLKDEFRELVLQDFIKSMPKLYRGENVYPGTWKNAINILMDNYFVNFKGVAFQKYIVFEEIEQMRWRLEYARKWFNGKTIKPLYPSAYLDPTRKHKKEVGFEYTKNLWNKRLKYNEKKKLKDLKRAKNAELRGKQINYSQKFERELKAFMNGRKELPQLIDFVQNNLPIEFYGKLREKLNYLQTNTLKHGSI